MKLLTEYRNRQCQQACGTYPEFDVDELDLFITMLFVIILDYRYKKNKFWGKK
jgi:hypothetical protein